MNGLKTSTAEKVIDLRDQRSYEKGWEIGYYDGLDDGYNAGYKAGIMMQKQKIRQLRTQRKAERQRALFFLKQKLVGALMLILTIGGVMASDGDITFAFFTLTIAFLLMFSKKKILIDKYYWEHL